MGREGSGGICVVSRYCLVDWLECGRGVDYCVVTADWVWVIG